MTLPLPLVQLRLTQTLGHMYKRGNRTTYHLAIQPAEQRGTRGGMRAARY